MSKIKVLWVEDKPQEAISFKGNVEADGTIELVNFTDANKACDYLDENIEELSGAVLDIESNLGDILENQGSFGLVYSKLKELKSRNPIEFFILSGKSQYFQQKGFIDGYKCEMFDKNYQSVEAVNHLLEIVARHKETKIRHKYANAFKVFECKVDNAPVFETAFRKQLVGLLESMENDKQVNANFVSCVVRPMAERILTTLTQLGVLDTKNYSWGDKTRNLANLGKDFKEAIPSYVVQSFQTIFNACPEGLHDCKQYLTNIQGEAPYLPISLTMDLLNILSWLPIFFERHNDYEANKAYFASAPEPQKDISTMIAEYEGKEFDNIQKKTIFYVGGCQLSCFPYGATKVRLTNVGRNKDKGSKFKVFAKTVEKVE